MTSGYFQGKLSKLIAKENLPDIKLKKRCRVIAPATRKGGCGKSVTVVSMAAVLAEFGYRVLVVDMDDSGDSTFNLGGSKIVWEYTMAHVFAGDVTIDDAVVCSEIVTKADGCIWFIGGGLANQIYSREYGHEKEKSLLLREQINKIRERFDFVLLDPPPTMGFWNISTLYAADYLISPITGPAEMSGYRAIRAAIEKSLAINSTLKHLGVFFTMANPQTVLYKDMRSSLERTPDLLFKTEIPLDIKLKEAFARKVPITLYAPNSRSAKAYIELTKEVLERCAHHENLSMTTSMI